MAIIQRAAADEAELRKAALNAGNAVRNKETDRMLADMSVERLREASRDKIRVGALTENGITSVYAVLINEHRLEQFDGIGETSAKRIRAAARTLRQNTFDEMPMRIDIKNRTRAHTEFLRRLGPGTRHVVSQRHRADFALAEELAPVAAVIDKTVTQAIVIPYGILDCRGVPRSGPSRRTVRLDDLQSQAPRAILATRGTTSWPGPPTTSRCSPNSASSPRTRRRRHGDLPDGDHRGGARTQSSTAEHLTASLRGYQSFGARFALVQRKVIIGDEMGLGKTVEALAVLAHLRSQGRAPLPRRLPRRGGDQLGPRGRPPSPTCAPTGSTGRTAHWAAKTWDRATAASPSPPTRPWPGWSRHRGPARARLRRGRRGALHQEPRRASARSGLRELIDSLRARHPAHRHTAGEPRRRVPQPGRLPAPRPRRSTPTSSRRRSSGGRSPRRTCAATRRTCSPSCPELVEVEEWLPMSAADDARATATPSRTGNFMAMRQAAMLQGTRSAKMQRLVEIVEEAEDNGRRVIVFSHFRDVLGRRGAAHCPARSSAR